MTRRPARRLRASKPARRGNSPARQSGRAREADSRRPVKIANRPGRLAFAKMPGRRECGIPRRSQPDYGRFPAAPYRESPITAQMHELPWLRFRSVAGRLIPADQPSVTRIPGSAAIGGNPAGTAAARVPLPGTRAARLAVR